MTSPQSDARRKAFALARGVGLDRQDRISLACMVTLKDVDSWSELDEPDILKVLTALEGFLLVTYLRWAESGFPDGAEADVIRSTSKR